MGRELRRVPLNFNWPLNKIWEGFLNPHAIVCPTCDGNGNTEAYCILEAILRLLFIAGEEANLDVTKIRPDIIYPHPYLQDLRNIDIPNRKQIDPRLAQLTNALAGEAPSCLGYSSAGYKLAKRLIEMAKLPEDWRLCPDCKGEGIHKDHFKASQEWRETAPPAGPGYQLWTTTNEGAPISPVFKTLADLCAWAAENATTFASFKATAAEWKQMLDDGMVYHKEGGMMFT